MNIHTLSNVTLETIENYRQAATLAVDAYRAGSHRLIDAVNEGLVNSVYSRTAKVAPQFTQTLSQVRGGLSDIIVKGVDGVSTGTGKAIEASSTAAAARVTQVADFAAGIENGIVVKGIDAAVRLSLPGAQAALTVSAKLAEGADALKRAAAGKKSPAAKVAKAAKAVKKVAVRAQRKATTVRATVSRKAAAAPRKVVAATKATMVRAKRKAKAVAAA